MDNRFYGTIAQPLFHRCSSLFTQSRGACNTPNPDQLSDRSS
ncbi:MAG: hypothetical protein NZ772_11860 [Cyanobacteria bacterium]|nr:hypothetical protein [Cyanobacteriota bacterium]